MLSRYVECGAVQYAPTLGTPSWALSFHALMCVCLCAFGLSSYQSYGGVGLENISFSFLGRRRAASLRPPSPSLSLSLTSDAAPTRHISFDASHSPPCAFLHSALLYARWSRGCVRMCVFLWCTFDCELISHSYNAKSRASSTPPTPPPPLPLPPPQPLPSSPSMSISFAVVARVQFSFVNGRVRLALRFLWPRRDALALTAVVERFLCVCIVIVIINHHQQQQRQQQQQLGGARVHSGCTDAADHQKNLSNKTSKNETTRTFRTRLFSPAPSSPHGIFHTFAARVVCIYIFILRE